MNTNPRSLAGLGFSSAWGLAILGILAGICTLLDPVAAGEPPLAAPGGRWLRAVWPVLAFGFAAWVARALLRLISTLLGEFLERDSRRSNEVAAGLDRATRLLERIAESLEQRPEPRAVELEKTQQGALKERIAELKAACEVNDPARALELYEAITPALEAEHRAALQTEVAQWFLTSIYRRLRTGKIQIEVVDLATRFAESFAATAQGASVQAALPTLRRSAGLCPRCAQQYTGVAKACPQCLRPATDVAAGLSPSIEPTLPE